MRKILVYACLVLLSVFVMYFVVSDFSPKEVTLTVSGVEKGKYTFKESADMVYIGVSDQFDIGQKVDLVLCGKRLHTKFEYKSIILVNAIVVFFLLALWLRVSEVLKSDEYNKGMD